MIKAAVKSEFWNITVGDSLTPLCVYRAELVVKY